MSDLVRTCRACGQARQVAVGEPCPLCGAAYGPLSVGLDRDPGESTVAETEPERVARFEADQARWLRELRARRTVVTNGGESQQETEGGKP